MYRYIHEHKKDKEYRREKRYTVKKREGETSPGRPGRENIGARKCPGNPSGTLEKTNVDDPKRQTLTSHKGYHQKGGVPAAPSGTATLLRLSPSHRSYPRPLLKRSRASGTPGFHGLTGGVYKARERIHRAVADARLLANPASRSRVADSDPN